MSYKHYYAGQKDNWKKSDFFSLAGIVISFCSLSIAYCSLRNTNKSVENSKKSDSSNIARFQQMLTLHEKENQALLLVNDMAMILSDENPTFKISIQNIGTYPAEIIESTYGFISTDLIADTSLMASRDTSKFYVSRGIPVQKQFSASKDPRNIKWKKGESAGFLQITITYRDLVFNKKKILRQAFQVYYANPQIYNVAFLSTDSL